MSLPSTPLFRALGAAALAGTLAACGGGSSTTEPGADVTLTLEIVSPTAQVDLVVGGTSVLDTKVTASNGSTPSGLPIASWISRSSTVATVSASGLVRGAGVGSTWVLAQLATSRGTLRDSIRVVVSAPETPQ